MEQVNGWTFTLPLEMAAAFTFCVVVVMTSPPSGAFVIESTLDRRSHPMIETVAADDGTPLTSEDIDGNISGLRQLPRTFRSHEEEIFSSSYRLLT
jgi:hypothetical protein